MSLSKWTELTDDSQARWNNIAEYWDDYMGEKSNRWHRELIRPNTEKLLDIKEGQTILDVACGNGNFSKRLAELGANVIAFDYSPKMIERAKLSCKDYLNRIDFKVNDATNYDSLMELGIQSFDSAVANMALMDIADITALVKSLQMLLKPNGRFVFSIPHPCFQPPNVRKLCEIEDVDGAVVSRKSVQISKYINPEVFENLGIKGQPTPHLIFHRPLAYYLNLFFESNFMLDGIVEPTFEDTDKEYYKFDWNSIPPVIIFRFRKV
jgi:2-polyprenyl-3-methyl-5-hydroxy-6-metoxy-1,4-benzoquinol methylase